MGEDLCVGYLLLSLYAQKLSEDVCVESATFSGVPLVDGPPFTAIQQCSENGCAVDLRLCGDPSSNPHVLCIVC